MTDPAKKKTVGTLEEARGKFRAALGDLKTYYSEIGGKEEILERYLFGPNLSGSDEQTVFWKWISWYDSVMPLSENDIARGFYSHNPGADDGLGDEWRPKAGQLKATLETICNSIDKLCEKGLARNELLNGIHRRYLERLTEITGAGITWPVKLIYPRKPAENNPPVLSSLGVLKQVIRDNEEELIRSVVQRASCPPGLDLPLEYLAAVFTKVFPDEKVSAGEMSLCFNLALTALQSCVLESPESIKNTLDSRIKKQKENSSPLIIYEEGPDQFKISPELDEIVKQAGTSKTG